MRKVQFRLSLCGFSRKQRPDRVFRRRNRMPRTDVDETIQALAVKVDALEADLETLCAAYNAKYVNSDDVRLSTVRYYGNAINSLSFIVALIKSEAPLCAVALVLILLITMIQQIGEEKRRKRDSQRALALSRTEKTMAAVD